MDRRRANRPFSVGKGETREGGGMREKGRERRPLRCNCKTDGRNGGGGGIAAAAAAILNELAARGNGTNKKTRLKSVFKVDSQFGGPEILLSLGNVHSCMFRYELRLRLI